MKFLSLLLIALIIGGVGFLYTQNDASEPTEFRVTKIEVGSLSSTITATGTIEPVEVVDVGAQIVGRIKSFGEDPNAPGKTIDFVSKVTAGSIIAQIDDLPYKAELERATADLRLAEAEVRRAKTQLEQATRDADRAEKARDSTSESEYESFVTAANIAATEVAIAEAKVAQARVLLKQAEINLDYTLIRSPIDGVVLDRRVNVGQTVVAGLNAPSLFLIAKDLKNMRVWAAVNEADIGQVSIGQLVSFSVDAYRDERFTGKVSQIRLNASTAHSVVTYGVIVDIDNSDGRLLPYMTANLEFTVANRDNVAKIPNQALRWKPAPDEIAPEFKQEYVSSSGTSESEVSVITESPTVWVQAGTGLVRPLTVKTGITDGLTTEIVTDNLKVGDEVVIGTVKKKQPDFVSSFVSRVTKSSKQSP